MESVIVFISQTAYQDLQDIEDYIAQDSPAIARSFIEQILDKAEQLKHHPLSGKPVSEIPDSTIKELLFKKYRIIYQIMPSRDVNILRIVHGARLFNADL